ncbi:hypothetical protein ACQQ2N_11990 [Dokdonella sp. MW10]|uniref:hypothetical protein n=1 Tax=Dokdonella sp. MW10 TaxID=2992926 RepID=UPI003F7E5518
MKRPLLATLALSMFAPVVAFAGTCAAPTSLQQSPNGTVAGTTCGGQAGIPLGGAVATHPSQVYSFRYNPAGPNGAAGPVTITGAEREVVIAQDCSSPPLGGAAPGVPVNIESMGLTAGANYIMVVTSDSGLAVTDPPRCGAFSMTWTTLPVTLQGFSVE